jgi:hypothetical protein
MSVRRGKADIAQEHAKGRFWREAVNEIQMEQFDFGRRKRTQQCLRPEEKRTRAGRYSTTAF